MGTEKYNCYVYIHTYIVVVNKYVLIWCGCVQLLEKVFVQTTNTHIFSGLDTCTHYRTKITILKYWDSNKSAFNISLLF